MLFNSIPFVVFFLPLFLAGFTLAGWWRGPRAALGFLLLASLFFYGWWNPFLLPLLAGSILGNHLLAGAMRRSRHRRRWLVAGLAANLCLLGWFKYAGLLATTGAALLGLLRLEMDRKLARGAALPSPKLVILAGSNAPFSHSCRVIGEMLSRSCENGGVAVGIGLDDFLLRWLPLLHKGDIAYLPMEVQQYGVTRAAVRMDVDGAMLFRHDRALLWRLGPGRVLGAAFNNTMPDGLEAIAEMAAHAAGLGHLHARLAAEFDRQGDRIGTTLAKADPHFLATLHRTEPPAAVIAQGYGTILIARFVRAATARGVVVIGGLPTDFRDVQLPASDIVAIRSIYLKNGGKFLELANHSRYPRADFYDSEDHLAEPCQYRHSMLVARGLAALLHRKLLPPTPAMLSVAERCPSRKTPPPSPRIVRTFRATRTADPPPPAG